MIIIKVMILVLRFTGVAHKFSQLSDAFSHASRKLTLVDMLREKRRKLRRKFGQKTNRSWGSPGPRGGLGGLRSSGPMSPRAVHHPPQHITEATTTTFTPKNVPR